MERRIVLTRDSPWFWPVAALGVAVAITLAILFFALFVGVLAAGLIAAPFLLLRRGRRPRGKVVDGEGEGRVGGGKVIDVEDYEVNPRLPEE
ncbi:MAG: hypothetical protein ACYTG3_06685 [Planctomycetota bacterium]